MMCSDSFVILKVNNSIFIDSHKFLTRVLASDLKTA